MCAQTVSRLYHIKYSVAKPGINMAEMKQAYLCGDCAYQITEEEKEDMRRIGRII
jgi:hypothetical protein